MADRLPYWRELMTDTLMPVSIQSDDRDFRAQARLSDLGVVQLTNISYPPLVVHRTPKLIRQSDPEQYQVCLTVRGGMRLEHLGRTAVLHEGDLVVYDPSRPFRAQITSGEGRVEHIVVQLPKVLCPLPEKEITRLLAAGLPEHDGLGRLVSRYLRELATHQPPRSSADACRLAAITMDLVMARLAHELEAERSLPAESRQQVLMARIHDFIARRLPDPRLTPEKIAQAHQISLRYLHKLFQAEGRTVAGWIRHQRLERCRRDLADPRLRERSIHAIATRWGFGDAAHFSRLFRAAYGLPPRDYRHLIHT